MCDLFLCWQLAYKQKRLPSHLTEGFIFIYLFVYSEINIKIILSFYTPELCELNRMWFFYKGS